MRETGVLGIDVGGTKTLCLLVDQKYEILAEEKFQTAPEDGRKKLLRSFALRPSHWPKSRSAKKSTWSRPASRWLDG
jgi:N-methylhydantoinase A/oxoprolinase/acetone carboxylase beta subunit